MPGGGGGVAGVQSEPPPPKKKKKKKKKKNQKPPFKILRKTKRGGGNSIKSRKFIQMTIVCIAGKKVHTYIGKVEGVKIIYITCSYKPGKKTYEQDCCLI